MEKFLSGLHSCPPKQLICFQLMDTFFKIGGQLLYHVGLVYNLDQPYVHIYPLPLEPPPSRPARLSAPS